MNIALIGYRGTGKTFVGKALAKKIGWGFIDTDEEIVKKEGRKISAIVKESGWEKFREVEKEVVKEVSGMDKTVIGCGGGVPILKENVDNLKKNSIIVLLEASAETIKRRVRRDDSRPALTDKSELEEIRHLLLERKPFYEGAADFKIYSEHYSIRENVEQIISVLMEKGVLGEGNKS